MSDRGPDDEAFKKPRRKKKPARVPKSRRGRPAKYQFIWQLMADEARLAKMIQQSESVGGVVGDWTPATEGTTTTEEATPRWLESSTNSTSKTQIDSNSDQHMKYSQPNRNVANKRSSDHSIGSFLPDVHRHRLPVHREYPQIWFPSVKHIFPDRPNEVIVPSYSLRRMSVLDMSPSLNGKTSHGRWLPVNSEKQMQSVTFGNSSIVEHISPRPTLSLRNFMGRRFTGTSCLPEVSRSNRKSLHLGTNQQHHHYPSPCLEFVVQTRNDNKITSNTSFRTSNKISHALDLSTKPTGSPDSPDAPMLQDITHTPPQSLDHIPGSIPPSDSQPSVSCIRQQDTSLTTRLTQSCIPSLRPFFRAIDSTLSKFGGCHQDIIQTHPQSFRSFPHRSMITRSKSFPSPGEIEAFDLDPAIEHLLRKGPQKIVLWDVERVVQLVSSIPGCQEYIDVFRQHEIDGFCLLDLDQRHLLDVFKMKLGPSMRLLKTIAYIHKLEQIA